MHVLRFTDRHRVPPRLKSDRQDRLEEYRIQDLVQLTAPKAFLRLGNTAERMVVGGIAWIAAELDAVHRWDFVFGHGRIAAKWMLANTHTWGRRAVEVSRPQGGVKLYTEIRFIDVFAFPEARVQE